MVTWNGAEPPALAPLTRAQKLRGGLRLVAVVSLTGAALGLFLSGKVLWRRVSRHVTFQFWIARHWARAMLWLMGVRFRMVGRPMKGGGLIAANHASWADILALRACRTINFVSKAEVRGWPYVGWIAAQCDTVFIERRRTATRAQEGLLRERMAKGELLCIFPEGTSTDGRRVLPFKSALLSVVYDSELRDGLRVQAATVNWTAPPGQPETFYCWWGTMPFEGHVWDVLCRSAGGAVEVVFHAPVAARDIPDRKALARMLEAQTRAAKRGQVAAQAVEAAP